uniref:Uncharacterized protein n=1 Tax=Glossina morsitans morsitans TaxID=37546 RepID=A0A1B0FBY1_GLOMM
MKQNLKIECKGCLSFYIVALAVKSESQFLIVKGGGERWLSHNILAENDCRNPMHPMSNQYNAKYTKTSN